MRLIIPSVAGADDPQLLLVKGGAKAKGLEVAVREDAEPPGRLQPLLEQREGAVAAGALEGDRVLSHVYLRLIWGESGAGAEGERQGMARLIRLDQIHHSNTI